MRRQNRSIVHNSNGQAIDCIDLKLRTARGLNSKTNLDLPDYRSKWRQPCCCRCCCWWWLGLNENNKAAAAAVAVAVIVAAAAAAAATAAMLVTYSEYVVGKKLQTWA